MSIAIITDSTSYLPKNLTKDYPITVLSLNIILDGESLEEVNISNDIFYKRITNAKTLPTSSQPNPIQIRSVFEECILRGDDIIAIFLSSKMSGTISTTQFIAKELLEKYPHANIEIIDSQTNCMQMGFSVLEAAKAAKSGQSFLEVSEIAKQALTYSKFIFTPDTLDYLHKGGRIGSAATLFGNLFQIKPLLTVVDGMTAIHSKVRTKKKAISTMIDTLLADTNQGALLRGITVHHINCEEEGMALAKMIEDILNIPVIVASIGPVIGLHVGPGSIGIAYYYSPSL